MTGSIILLVVLIFLNAVFASAEIAVISMNETKLKKLVEQEDRRAMKLAALTRQPARFLATIQVAITLAGLLSSAFAADNFAEPLVDFFIEKGVTIPENVLKTAAVVVITLALAYFNLVLGELVPKRIAMKKADGMALGMAGLLYGVSKVFFPLVALLTWSTNSILKLLQMNPEETEDGVTEEELRMMLAEGNEQGIIDEHENEIIQNLFDFGDIAAQQICTHRLDVAALEENDTAENWEQVIFEKKHTYYPVYRESKDNVIGVLDTRDFFRMQRASREEILAQAMRPAYFVPEEIKADVLFQNMRRERKYFAVLLDEYGGLSGIITIRDLVEAIVGDLYEEDDPEEAERIRHLEEQKWVVCGDADLDEVSKVLGVELPTDTYDTFNGLVYSIIGGIPEDGSSFECRDHGLQICVQAVEKHRIERAVVEVL